MNIRERRIEKGWTQEELARHSGLSSRTIQRIETGNNAGLESLKSLAAVFETSISVLMQEQTMTEQQTNNVAEKLQLLKIERDAIDFAQSILADVKEDQNDPLTKLEREAIHFAKKLLGKFFVAGGRKPD